MFVEKLNKKQEGNYVIQEEKIMESGRWEGFLNHDNVNGKTISIYTEPNFEGEKVNNYLISTPIEAPWKTYLKVFSNSGKVYIVYETTGDQVEADDINKLQDELVNEINRATTEEIRIDTKLDDEIVRSIDKDNKLDTRIDSEISRSRAEEKRIDTKLDNEISRATSKENQIESNLNNEIIRSTNKDNALDNKIDSEIFRSTTKETLIENSLNNYKTSNDSEVTQLKTRATSLESNKSDKIYVDAELNKRADKLTTYTKIETDARIQNVVGAAPEALDTLHEIAQALNNDKDFAGTITNELAKKVDKVVGKGLSDENYTAIEKSKLSGVANNATKNDTDTNLQNRANHTGTQAASTISDFANVVRTTVLTGISTATNAVITATDSVLGALGKLQKQITDNLTTSNSHINNKINPHGTTKSDVGLGDVDNTKDMDKPIGNATQNALNLKADKTQVLTNVPANAKFTDTIFTHPDTASIRHVTDTEKSAWNNKADKVYVDTTFATKTEIGSAGYGDMLKSVYDTNNDGKVDKAVTADAVPWAGVSGKPSTFSPVAHTHAIANITSLQDILDAKETPSGAQTKANAAEVNAINASVNNISSGSTADPNTTQIPYILTNHANSPGGSIYCHILTMFYSSKTGNRAQIAVSYNGSKPRMFTRHYFTTWLPWVEVTTKGPLTCNDLKGV